MDIKKIAVIISAILIFSVGGYFIWKSFSGSGSSSAPFPSPTPGGSISPEDARDDQRIKDILYLSGIIDIYNLDHDGHVFIAKEGQKISDEGSAVFRELKDSGYLDKALKDPVPDKYYYGYYSDGHTYELTAVLENKSSGKCEIFGDLCVYKISKKDIPFFDDGYQDDQGGNYDYETEYIGPK